jgi:FKBP-type peptidyl-prolyl cis-trans isomerase SlpA
MVSRCAEGCPMAYNSGLPVTRVVSMSNVVTASAYLTLHYRLASMDGTNIVSTFEGNPATLMLGQGQLAPNLEALLIGLPEGTHKVFELAAGEAFGPRNPGRKLRSGQ